MFHVKHFADPGMAQTGLPLLHGNTRKHPPCIPHIAIHNIASRTGISKNLLEVTQSPIQESIHIYCIYT